jgi:hypothetical protein
MFNIDLKRGTVLDVVLQELVIRLFDVCRVGSHFHCGEVAANKDVIMSTNPRDLRVVIVGDMKRKP